MFFERVAGGPFRPNTGASLLGVYLCEIGVPEQKKIDAQNSPERGWAIKALPTNAIQTL